MEESEIDAYVKYNWFHCEQRMHYEPSPFSSQALYYNAEGDYYICPMGQRMNRIGTYTAKTESGYIPKVLDTWRNAVMAVHCEDVALMQKVTESLK